MNINVSEFKEKLQSNPGEVIDVRTKKEFNEGHLKSTAAQYDWLNGEFHEAVESMDKNKTYYLYCRSGNRSGQAAQMMRDRGFEHAYNVGGFEDLVKGGFEPVIPESDE
jgi:phage shock protein E